MPVHSRRNHLWNDFFDSAIPAWVKRHYSPKESWKDKPFEKSDVRFFQRGVQELSDRFTEGRHGSQGARGMASYFEHERFRSSYLLYFLPLQAAKFLNLFDMYPQALAPLTQKSTIRILDLGAGPGTATLALLVWLSQQPKIPEKIEIDWVDTQAAILRDGRALLDEFLELVPRFKERVKLSTHTQNWWDSHAALNSEPDFVLLGNVLNEGLAQGPKIADFWQRLVAAARTSGVLYVEPADRGSSQLLSRLRDQMLQEEWIAPTSDAIWGPCLHAGSCPMAQGRDWCHTSVRAEIVGKWFREFSIALGSTREWIKFSYLWVAAPKIAAQHPGPTPPHYRVLSDLLGDGAQLLCQPDVPLKMRITSKPRGGPGRGDLWQLGIGPAPKDGAGNPGGKTRIPRLQERPRPRPKSRRTIR